MQSMTTKKTCLLFLISGSIQVSKTRGLSMGAYGRIALGTHARGSIGVHPVAVVFPHVLGEGQVGRGDLIFQGLEQPVVAELEEVHAPGDQVEIDGLPVGRRRSRRETVPQGHEIAHVVPRDLFPGQLAGLELPFQGGEDLQGADRLDQVVVDPLADGAGHQVFRLALGDHDHRDVRVDLAHLPQGFQAAHAGHHFIQQDGVEILFLHHLEGVQPVGHAFDLVSLFTQVTKVAAEFVDVVIDPEYAKSQKGLLCLQEAGPSGAGGMVTRKVVPCWLVDSIRILPL